MDIINSNISIINTHVNESENKKLKKIKKNSKLSDDDFKILKPHEYNQIHICQYKVCHLKEMCKSYKLKKSGNKDELKARLFDFLRLSLYITVIQRNWRGYLLREYVKCSGPALKDRSICVNDTDFATLEPVDEICYNQFYSFSGNNNCYGCDIYSLHNLINKQNDTCNPNIPIEIKNPYDREIITANQITRFNRYLRLAKALNISFKINDEKSDIIDPKKKLEMNIIEIFQYINELGNYADSTWFTNLPRHMMVLFIREVYDIWHYRAQLSQQTMRDIVPPHGNPFTGMTLHLAQSQSDEYLKNTALRIIHYLVKTGYTNETRALGAYYVLAALTLVSEDARNALPWLYQSVAH
tara:strand:- start:36 stop:1100 length:1065 start_codon:yes stop_codon:yes gene_type:complete